MSTIPAAERRLAGRTALVTGATRGIGRAVALALAREGAHLILTGRTSGALAEVDDEVRAVTKAATGAAEGATLITLNLKHAEKVDALGPTLISRFPKLDILVANAGVLGTLSPLTHLTNDGFLDTLDVNLTANWRLIRSLDPLLQKSDAGRAIFVTSGAARAKNAYWGPYAVSKAGLEALVKTYALECASTNVRANLINPGPIRTRMRAKAFPGEDPMSLKTPEDIAPAFVRFALPTCSDNGVIFDFSTGQIR